MLEHVVEGILDQEQAILFLMQEDRDWKTPLDLAIEKKQRECI